MASAMPPTQRFPSPQKESDAKHTGPLEQPALPPEREGGDASQKSVGEVKPLRTFERDIQETVERENVSLVSIALAEHEKKLKGPLHGGTPAERRENRLLAIGAALFVLAGIAVAGFLWFTKKTVPVVLRPVPKPLILLEEAAELIVPPDSMERLRTLFSRERRTRSIPLSSVVGYTIITDAQSGTILTAEEFLSLFKPAIPGELRRTVNPEFLIGLHGFRENQPFLVFKVRNYQTAFAGMLSWEPTLRENLEGIFFQPPRRTAPPATTTSGTLRAAQPAFVDAVLRNRDARLLKDASGKTFLLYSFPDHETLVITTGEDTLREVMERLIAGRLER